ncbi:MAG: 4-hydroxy-tetrahydrodipicolinate reductase [Plectolyngbya sp. WJT66-NPBG17]|jgi:4-hydroxy-tetrahydrodipicolinate reductase|nr:4-hydroxy-tetrahydrodipicolinate reductase [Plectolyngbya sp. WJT66-NPBG17]
MAGRIPVVVNGATGKMGREIIKAVSQSPDMNLIGAIARNPDYQGEDIGEIIGCGALEVPVTNEYEPMMAMLSQEKELGVVVDVTHPDAVYGNVRSAIAYGVRPVVGTTGLSAGQIRDLAEFADKASTGCLIVPNFSIGVVLMQQAAIQASQYFDHVEIIELHHNQKADAPSGTAVQTAQMLAEMGKTYNEAIVSETEKITGARGAQSDEGIRIHSIRLPGLVAHQEIIFGAQGQIYTLRHDATDRTCYMPGVLLSIRKVIPLKSLVYGLEKIL